jgi:hypothetical protein
MQLKRGQIIRIVIAVLLLAFVAAAFLYTKKCENYSCFSTYLAKCNKASYVDNTQDSIWEYKIKGAEDGFCKVNVKLLRMKEGSTELTNLEQQEMVCYVYKGKIEDPKKDLTRCHGELKENIQDILIQKMHAYILDNVGKISEEFQHVI